MSFEMVSVVDSSINPPSTARLSFLELECCHVMFIQ